MDLRNVQFISVDKMKYLLKYYRIDVDVERERVSVVLIIIPD